MQNITFNNDKVAILHLLVGVRDAFNKGDVEKAVSYHTENVVLMESNMPAIAGRQQLKELFTKYFINKRAEKTALKLSFEVLEIEVMGSRAFARGSVLLTTLKEGIEPVSNKGKFLCLFQKQQDGSWLRSHIVSNSDSSDFDID